MATQITDQSRVTTDD